MSLDQRADPNYLGAFFSFLRVLTVALASALLPLFTADQEFTARAVLIPAGAAFTLTVINFFREGESRFGPPPNVVVEEG